MNTIIFDFDGTLADTRPVIVHTIQQVLADCNLPPQPDHICAATIGLPLREAFEVLVPTDAVTAEMCAESYRRHFAENVRKMSVPMFPNVIDTLHRLADAGLTLTIASSRSRASLLHFVEDLHLKDCITCVVAADDVTYGKPHPEPALLMMRLLLERGLEVRPKETLVVGDTSYDIEMGRQAGCYTCGVTYGNHSRGQLEAAGADHIIDDFSQLTEILANDL